MSRIIDDRPHCFVGHSFSSTNGGNRAIGLAIGWHVDKPGPQRRLNRFLPTPEIVSMKDNLVGGPVVVELPLATAGALANCLLAATLGSCGLMTFPLFLFLSTSTTVGDTDAYDCSGDGSLGTASSTSAGGGTIVGWLVSITTRSGGCSMDAIRMTGLLIASCAGSGEDLGRYQSATNSNARSDAPTQAMYRPIGITVSRRYSSESKRRNS